MQHFEVFNPIINNDKTYTAFINPTGIEVQSNAISKVETELSLIWEKLNFLQRTTPEFVELSCRNCGATLKQGYLDPIVKCPYCKTVYAVGYKQVNSV